MKNKLFKKSPWEKNDRKIWIGSVLSFQRNLENFNFPPNTAAKSAEKAKFPFKISNSF